MKTASDIVMAIFDHLEYVITGTQYKRTAAFVVQNPKAMEDYITQAKALAKAERKVLESVEPICKQLMLANTPITQEAAEFIQAYIELYKLREEMGL